MGALPRIALPVTRHLWRKSLRQLRPAYLLSLRVPILDMTVLAGAIDAVADFEKFVLVLCFDGLQHRQYTVVQIVRHLREAGAILIDQLLDLFGRNCNSRIHLFTGPRDASAWHEQQI